MQQDRIIIQLLLPGFDHYQCKVGILRLGFPLCPPDRWGSHPRSYRDYRLHYRPGTRSIDDSLSNPILALP